MKVLSVLSTIWMVVECSIYFLIGSSIIILIESIQWIVKKSRNEKTCRV